MGVRYLVLEPQFVEPLQFILQSNGLADFTLDLLDLLLMHPDVLLHHKGIRVRQVRQRSWSKDFGFYFASPGEAHPLAGSSSP